MIWGQTANLWRERDRANGPDQVITCGCSKLAPLILRSTFACHPACPQQLFLPWPASLRRHLSIQLGAFPLGILSWTWYSAAEGT